MWTLQLTLWPRLQLYSFLGYYANLPVRRPELISTCLCAMKGSPGINTLLSGLDAADAASSVPQSPRSHLSNQDE